MELLPKPVNFEDIWNDLKNVVQTLIFDEIVDAEIWTKEFSDIYRVCVSHEGQMGVRLYREIKSFIEQLVRKLRVEISPARVGAEFLQEYYQRWQRYLHGVENLNQLFSYLNLNVIKKHKYSSVDIDYLQYGISYEDHLLEIGELACAIWERELIQPLHDKLTQCLLDAVLRHRLGQDFDDKVMKGVISSLIVLLKFEPRNQLRLYENLFEIPFFEASARFLTDESQRLGETCECSEFMRKILSRIESENELYRSYLDPSSFVRLRLNCRDHLLSNNIAYINNHCSEMMRSEKWHDLGMMYDLLSDMDNGLNQLVAEFEEHLRQSSLKQINSLKKSSSISDEFVKSMLEFYQHYRMQIKNIFRNNPRFLSAFDKAFLVAVNLQSTPKGISKAPELLARYCHKLMRKGSGSSPEMDLEDSLTQVMILFNYIDDKDIFQRFYADLLSKRLIFHLSISMEAEESMINRLQQSCGYEYTRKLHCMFSDMTLSSDLNTVFSQHVKDDATRKISHNFTVQILQSDAWPISQSNLLPYVFPQELEKFIQVFENFYKTLHSGRKLIWMHNLSLVELKFCHLPRPYLVTMEMLLVSILLQFNVSLVLSFREIFESCQLPNQDLVARLKVLINAKILEMKGQSIETATFQLNSKFTHKKTKFKLLPISQADTAQAEDQMLNSVEEDRRQFLEASIMRTMKARKESTHAALVEEVISQSKLRFAPRVGSIKKCIRILEDRQYIGRAKDREDVYIYLA